MELDNINPSHYKDTPGCECIEVTEQLSFSAGNAVKYLWRAGTKPGVSELEDFKKARWYIARACGSSNDPWRPFGRPAGFNEALEHIEQRGCNRAVAIRKLVTRQFPEALRIIDDAILYLTDDQVPSGECAGSLHAAGDSCGGTVD